MLGWLILVNNEIILLNTIADKVTNIETSLNVSTTAILYFLGGIIAVFVCYLLYKSISNFISF